MSVYGNIAGEIRGRIKCGQYVPGHKLESEPELAKTFTVARKTLRRALLILESEGLIVRKKKSGTVIAHPGSKLRTGTQLYYFGEYDTHFFKEFFVCLMEESQRRGVNVNAHDFCKVVMKGVDIKHRIADLEEHPMFVVQASQYQKFKGLFKRSVPARTVLIDIVETPMQDCNSYCVCPDLVRAGIEAAEHLIGLGHRRIAYLGAYPMDIKKKFPPPDPKNSFYIGYLSALARNGLSSAGAYAFFGSGDEAIENICGYVKSLKKIPSAFVCHADFRAISAIKAMDRLKLKVPGDVSITGCFNTPWCEVSTPELTSVASDQIQMARTIMDLFSNPPPDKLTRIYVEPSIVVRKSTSASEKGINSDPVR